MYYLSLISAINPLFLFAAFIHFIIAVDIPESRKVLLEVKLQIEENEEAFGKSYKKPDFVFVKSDGERYTPNTIYQLFAKFLRDQGLPHMRWHDLPYSCASVLYDRDWDMKPYKNG